MYHYAGNNPVRYVDPDGLFSVQYDNETDLLAFNKPFTQMMAIPLGGGLTGYQQDIRKLTNILNAAIGFIPHLSDYNVFFTGNETKDILINLGKSVLGIFPQTSKMTSVFDFASALFSQPSINAENYTNTEKELLTMIGIEQSFAHDFCEELSKKGIPFSKNYSNETSSFIANISILGDWANPKEELEQIFNAVKDLKPELYKEVQIDF